MPRDFHSESLLHGLYGSAAVQEQQQAEASGVYTLVVADFHNFFAGVEKTLVHDATTPSPTDAATPGWSPLVPMNHLASTVGQTP